VTLIRLDEAQLQRASAEGRVRHERAAVRKRAQKYGQSHSSPGALRLDIAGAQAELAIAEAVGVEWRPRPATDRDEGDVIGPDGAWQVRSTTYFDTGHLPAHPDDPDEWRLVLVLVEGAWCRIAGWLPARQCKRREWWRTRQRHPCFMVPQLALHPFSTRWS
jgi:hypothetical protein